MENRRKIPGNGLTIAQSELLWTKFKEGRFLTYHSSDELPHQTRLSEATVAEWFQKMRQCMQQIDYCRQHYSRVQSCSVAINRDGEADEMTWTIYPGINGELEIGDRIIGLALIGELPEDIAPILQVSHANVSETLEKYCDSRLPRMDEKVDTLSVNLFERIAEIMHKDPFTHVWNIWKCLLEDGICSMCGKDEKNIKDEAEQEIRDTVVTLAVAGTPFDDIAAILEISQRSIGKTLGRYFNTAVPRSDLAKSQTPAPSPPRIQLLSAIAQLFVLCPSISPCEVQLLVVGGYDVLHTKGGDEEFVAANVAPLENYDFVAVGKDNEVFRLDNFGASATNLRSIKLINVQMEFQAFIDGILASKELRSITIERVEFTRRGQPPTSDVTFFTNLVEFVQFAPQGQHFFAKVFYGAQIEFVVKAENVEVFKFSAENQRFESRLTNGGKIVKMLTFQPPSDFGLKSLHLHGTELECTDALKVTFGSLHSLSLHDVRFREEKMLSFSMPDQLFESLKRLKKLAICVGSCDVGNFQGKIQTIPPPVTHVSITGYGPLYYHVPLDSSIQEFEYVNVSSNSTMHNYDYPDTPLNTKYLRIDSLLLLAETLRVDMEGIANDLKFILVKQDEHDVAFCNDSLVTLLMRQLQIPKSQKVFLLFRDSSDEPWKVEFPSNEILEELEQNFLISSF